MKKTSDVVCCVVDHGLFIPIAKRLARDFKKVFYCCPHEDFFPTIRKSVIGDGYSDIEKVESPWEVISKCDLFVFPSSGFQYEQRELRSRGIPVFGCGDAGRLESNRGLFQKFLSDNNLPMTGCKIVAGMSNLKDYLKEKKDLWIKVSKFRGDWETFHWEDWEQSECDLDVFSVAFGPFKNVINFYIFEPIKSEIEGGLDTFCIDGKIPNVCIQGYEAKDKAYIATFVKYDSIAHEIRQSSDKLFPVIGEMGFRGAISTEVKIVGDIGYFIDVTPRFGCPPSQVQQEMIGNFSELVWNCANGICIEPDEAFKFGIQVAIEDKSPRKHWSAFRFDPEIRDNLKLEYCCCLDGVDIFPPDMEQESREIGYLVSVSNSIEDAVDEIKKMAKLLPKEVICDTSSLSDLIKELHLAESKGIEFTNQKIPKPSIVVE